MLTLSARTRIAELAAGPPGPLAALAATGLYRPGDSQDVTLGQLCWTHGFNPGVLLMILQSANQPPVEPPVLDPAPFLGMALDTLVGHIVSVHHEGLRQRLPRLVAQAEEAAAWYADDDVVLGIRHGLRALAQELEAHLAHEEEALFPMLRDLASGSAVTPTRCGGSVGGPIACMENEHAETLRTLARLATLAESRKTLGEADPAWRELGAGIGWLAQDLREHIYKEDHILFPRALEAQRAGRVSPPGAAVPLF